MLHLCGQGASNLVEKKVEWLEKAAARAVGTQRKEESQEMEAGRFHRHYGLKVCVPPQIQMLKF